MKHRPLDWLSYTNLEPSYSQRHDGRIRKRALCIAVADPFLLLFGLGINVCSEWDSVAYASLHTNTSMYRFSNYLKRVPSVWKDRFGAMDEML